VVTDAQEKLSGVRKPIVWMNKDGVGFYANKFSNPYGIIALMTTYTQPVTELIQKRFSCRKYHKDPIPLEKQKLLRERMSTLTTGLFGTPMRFDLISAEGTDGKALRGLGTYGFIQGASGFVVAAMSAGKQNLEEYGYRMEEIVLAATDLGMGTCWLGGTFTKSTFARKISLQKGESMPAILAIGLMEDETQARSGALRLRVGGDKRLSWQTLFYDEGFDTPLSREKAREHEPALEMVRIAPSASNKQPWRIVQTDQGFHFILQRTRGYRSIMTRLVNIDDMQRLDMGIAMCHFELAARELGLNGKWELQKHAVELPDDQSEYTISWIKDLE